MVSRALKLLDVLTSLLPLCALHAGLDVLVHKQYRQVVESDLILRRVVWAIPGRNLIPSFCLATAFVIMISIIHPRNNLMIVKFGLFLASIAAGCYIIWITNHQGYYETMKRAPPLGSIWIWSVVEMDLAPCIISSVLVFAYYLIH
jgi:hypothetical protein